MLRNLTKIIKPLHLQENLLNPDNILHQQLRTTFILKRKYPAPLHKNGLPPKRLRPKHYIYELIKDTSVEKKPDLNLILTQYVEGLGNPGEKVTVAAGFGYNKLLLPGLAVYASPENLKKFEDYRTGTDDIKHSSPYAQGTAQHLSRMVLSVVMSKDNPWTLQPWHIRSSFRKCGYTVPEEAITMPSKVINGPNMDLQDKEFYVTVTINNLEKANVRCRIHHWSTNPTERMPHVHEFWKESPGAVFEEDESTLNSMPKKGHTDSVQ